MACDVRHAFGPAARSASLWVLGALVLAAPIPAVAADKMASVDRRQVKIGGEIGRRIDVTIANNLLKLNADKDFVQPFLDKKAKDGFVGLGMLIDATVRLAAYSKDPRAVDLKKRLVAAAIHAQEPDGYLGMLVPASRMWELWDIHEMGYLIFGLTSDYRFFGEKDSLAAARGLADYVLARWGEKPDWKAGGLTAHMAVTGLERTLLTLAEATGDAKYRQFCVVQRKLPEWDLGIVVGRWGQIEGHAYAYFAHCLAQLQLYRSDPSEKLLGPVRRAMDFVTRRDGLAVTGTCGDNECWHESQSGTINLGETCATAYLIRTLDDLLRLEGDSRYGDMLERALYNALFAAQSPDGRRIRYYTPFDGLRSYFQSDSYCCPNNYRRIISELPSMVYYRSGSGLAVNLYTPSSARVELDGGVTLSVRQETEYPNSGRVVVHIDPSNPAAFPVLLRIPRWSDGAKVAVNGQPIAQPVRRGEFLIIEREWKAGNSVELNMPMTWRLVRGRKAQSGRVAIMRGPVVFCLDRAGRKDLAGLDLHLVTIQPESLQGPAPDVSVRPGGLAGKVQAWPPGDCVYPHAKPALELTLREFPDPAGEATYFHVPNPKAKEIVADELIEAE
jgi:uncharacterized protein